MAPLWEQKRNEVTEIGNLAMTHFETLSDDEKAWYVRHLAMRTAEELSAKRRKCWLANLQKKTNANGDQNK